MKARAPGKLVLSGAYAVLHGAPAVVTAVDRYVVADTAGRAEMVTPEVAAALGAERAPAFDAAALRNGEKKLGLGSSAAILVASLAARELETSGPLEPFELARRVLGPALAAHHAAQGGGSGIDVLASSFGGTLSFERSSAEPTASPVRLPARLVVEAWWSGSAASTAELLGKVRALAERHRSDHDRLMRAQADAAASAVAALDHGDAGRFVQALDAQGSALAALGAAAGASIVTSACEELRRAAQQESATALPAGAGGGDVVLYVGQSASSEAFGALAARLGHERLQLAIDAPGVHAADAAHDKR